MDNKVCKPMQDNDLYRKGQELGLTVKPLSEYRYSVTYPGLSEPIIMDLEEEYVAPDFRAVIR